MSLYQSYVEGKLTATEATMLKSQVYAEPLHPHSATTLCVWLNEGEFVFNDGEFLCATKSLDAALFIMVAGSDARQILGIPRQQVLEVITPLPLQEPVMVDVSDSQRAMATRLAEKFNVRRSSQGGEPVDHTKEGAVVRQVGIGDGPPKLG